MKHTLICIASGPSLTRDDVEYCRDKGRVYVVKECRNLAPWADVLYAADADWWQKFNGCGDFAGERWTVNAGSAEKYGLKYAEAKSEWNWSTTPGALATGGNSGFQTMNLATLQGVELYGDDFLKNGQLILLGFDYGHAPGQDKHWWEKEYPRDSRWSNYAEWNKRLAKAAPFIPVPVLNASRESAITCFPRVNLRDVV